MKAWPYLAKARHPTLGCEAMLWHCKVYKNGSVEEVGPFVHIEDLWSHCNRNGMELLRFQSTEPGAEIAPPERPWPSLADIACRSGAMGDPRNRDEWPIDLVLEAD